ncbi:STAS domain-containing protein [Streptomyces jumonjinensis]|uniref:STAS domain-containing protein n=1 Tax=Streptomyces jumonjinensis TaxID=1945 RepID=UPI00379F01F7
MTADEHGGDPARTGPGRDPERVVALETATVTNRLRQGHAVLTVTGELDVYSAPGLRDLLTELIETTRGGDLICDMSQVRFFDSTSVGVLVGAHHRLRPHPERTLRVVAADGPVRTTLHLTGLDRTFHWCASLQEALHTAGTTRPAGIP